MRFCIILACALYTITAHAQIEMRINGGVGCNSRPYYDYKRMLSRTAKPMVNIAGSAEILYNVNRWQFGAGIHIQQMSRKDGLTKYIYGNPAYIISLIANRKLGSFYYGFGIGYLVQKDNQLQFEEKGKEKIAYVFNGNGVNANLHVGYSKYFGRFGINGRVNGNLAYASDRFIMSNGSQPIEKTYKFGYFHYSFLVGVGYRF